MAGDSDRDEWRPAHTLTFHPIADFIGHKFRLSGWIDLPFGIVPSMASPEHIARATDDITIGLIGAGAAIAGGLISGAYQHARDWFNRPKLRIESKETAANKVDVQYKQSDGTVVSEIYIRARVRNAGRHIARGCVVFLAKLEKVHPSGGTTSTVFFDSRPLAWAGWGFPRVTFHPGWTSMST